MQLEHLPRITGSPSRTETKTVWTVSAQLQIYYQATTTAHFICSSSIHHFIDEVRRDGKYRGRNHDTVLEILHAKSTSLFDPYEEYDCHKNLHVQVRRIAFKATYCKYYKQFLCNEYTIHISFWFPDWTSFKLDILVRRDYECVEHDESRDAKLYCGASLARKSAEDFIPIYVFRNTAFKYSNHYETKHILPSRSFLIKNRTRLYINSLDNTTTETINLEHHWVFAKLPTFRKWKESENTRQARCSAYQTNWLQDNTIIEHKHNNVLLAKDDNRAWTGQTIRERSTSHFHKYEKHDAAEFSRRKLIRTSYGSLFLLYFLALPLLCSTYPSTGIITSVSFVQKSSLVFIDNSTVHNLSPVARLRSGGNRIDGQSHNDRSQDGEQVHPYNEYTWEVNQINPWLSACDLAGPAPADLQGSCGPPEVPKYCPISCALSINSDRIFHEVVERLVVPRKWRTGSAAKMQWKTIDRTVKGSTAPDQCLFYLEESHKRDICQEDFARSSSLSFATSRENRYWFLSGLRLRHCCEYAVINALAPGNGGPLEDVLNGSPRCSKALEKILSVDALAARLHCEFEEVLARYDCRQSYSVIHNCTHCKEAYRKWVCSSLVPYFAHEGPSIPLNSGEVYVGTRLRPCRSFCQSVEQRCPYLLPGDRAPAYPTQYAGEPTFLCRDPNIPETGGQAVRALHGDEEEECCFRVCSEDDPASGVCANCTYNKLHGRRIGRDPPLAPHCEMTSTSQPNFAGC
ncbi:uncharacterized protein LOC107040103 isoform X2 [Diachasma alloeum]|uniref:uncharacterized protein LOC107040103 isoform X2 n=1 Tax=Diachasma alloeum TaxID=454923 RepID=UPI000738373D|nr:uncharacterized protein LOC107040103 isoform X2 [Diachasma alloeum]